ncbi:MAG: hypothetical protein ABW168_05800 [Sedimenticola sp.]
MTTLLSLGLAFTLIYAIFFVFGMVLGAVWLVFVALLRAAWVRRSRLFGFDLRAGSG